ncbi:hypothetical protein H1R20_g10052, partial [Candolleomyces eurysporus]
MELTETQRILEQLAQYSRTYYTRDYEEFTSEWIGNILTELKSAPYVDSRALAPPSDPFMTLSKLERIESLKPYDEVLPMDKEAVTLVKKAMPPKVSPKRLRTERAANNINAYPPTEVPALDPDFILFARSRNHLTALGKRIYRKKLPSGVGALNATHIPGSLTIEDVDAPISVDETLNVEYQLKERNEVYVVVEPLLRLYKKPERSRRPGHRFTEDSKATAGPHNLTALPDVISTDLKLPSSDDSISRQNMRVVDGWETIYSSPPPSQESRASTETVMIDELGMPSTPDTDPPLVELVQNSQQEPPLFPRSRRIGGRDGVRPHILKYQTLNSFLSSVLPTFPEAKPRPRDVIASSPNPATSLVGQTSVKDEIVDPDFEDGVDADIKRLCSQAASYSEILEDRIDDKAIELMEVPSLPEPTEHQPHSWIPTIFTELVTPSPAANVGLPRPFMKKAPGKHSISLALSWVYVILWLLLVLDAQKSQRTFTVTEQLPPLSQVLDLDTPLDSSPELLQSIVEEVERLFRKCSIPVSEENPMDEPPESPEPYLAILDSNDLPLVKSPLDQHLLLLSRLERCRALGKRKSEDVDDIEEAHSPVVERIDFKSSHGSRKRVRTVSPTPSPETCGGAGELRGDHDMSGMGVTTTINAHSDVNFEEDKENWDPSFHTTSDPINPPSDDIMLFEWDNQRLYQPSNTASFVAQDDYDMDSQLAIENFGEEPVYATFDPLLTETQPCPPAIDSALPSPRPLPPSHPPIHDRDTAIIERSDEISQEPRLSFDALQAEKGLFSHSMGILDFTRLRCVKISEPQQDQYTKMDVASTTTPLDSSSVVQVEEPQTAPPDLFGKNTFTLDDVDTTPPSTVHHYMASLDVLQKRALTKSLNSSNCLVGLIERTTLGGVHLIVDCSTAIIFVPLLALPSECSTWIERVAVQSWKYNRIHIVFEAYPESCALKSQVTASELYAYTPPILKAVKKFSRDIEISEACNSKSSECLVTYSFADSVLDAARLVRHVGNLAEEQDVTGGAIWGDRQWLENEHKDEGDLENVAGLNPFSSALILSQVSVEDFLRMSSQARLDHFGSYLGDVLNEDIEIRVLNIMEKDTGSAMLYEDIIDKIIDLSSSDFHNLASLCRVSRAFAQIARKHLYKDLDLTPPAPTLDEYRLRELRAKAQRRQATLDHNHLQEFVRSLTFSVEVGCNSDAYTHNLGWMSVAAQIKSNIQHVNLAVWGQGRLLKFRNRFATYSVRSQVEEILGSSSLKSITLDFHSPAPLLSLSLPAFPDWILRSISFSINKVNVNSWNGHWNDYNGPVRVGDLGSTPAVVNVEVEQRRPRHLEDLSLMIDEQFGIDEKFAHWFERLTGPCFKLHLSKTKKVTIGRYAPGDDFFWRIPEEASNSLEELAITSRFCRARNLSLRPNLFAQYQMLHTLSFNVSYITGTSDSIAGTASYHFLMEIFTQTLPSTLGRVVINLWLGRIEEYALPKTFDSEGEGSDSDRENFTCWRKLDEALNEHQSLKSVIVNLEWATTPKSPGRTAFPVPASVQQERWRDGLNVFLEKWKELFGRIERRRILDLRYTCTQVAPIYIKSVDDV